MENRFIQIPTSEKYIMSSLYCPKYTLLLSGEGYWIQETRNLWLHRCRVLHMEYNGFKPGGGIMDVYILYKQNIKFIQQFNNVLL